MPTGTVQAKGVSRTQKPTVTIDGQLYSASKTDPPSAGLQVGDRIEFDSASSLFNGSIVWFLNSWKLLEGAQKYPSAPQHSGGIAAPSAPVAALVSISAPILDAERPCISNWGAEAIKAGLVKSPGDMIDWVRCWKEALRADTSDIP